MADDIVERLRDEAKAMAGGDWSDHVIGRRFTEAADEIERLWAAVERLLSALLPLSIAGAQDDVNELFAAIKEARRER